MRCLRTHGITSDKTLMHPRPEIEIWNYQQIELGFNYRMTDIQAALGLSQFSRLDEFVASRHEIAKRYDRELDTLPIVIPWQSPQTYSSYHLYPIRIPESSSNKLQRQTYAVLIKEGIGANLHYIPVHRQPYYEQIGFKVGDYLQAERFHREVISLPIFPRLPKAAQTHVISVLAKELIDE
jgi:dTDP-4-amino-4,6-dideoxygalactose transaminase